MQNQKPMSKSRSALIRKIEEQIKEADKVQADYQRAKKLNPGFRIPFMEDQPTEGSIANI